MGRGYTIIFSLQIISYYVLFINEFEVDCIQKMQLSANLKKKKKNFTGGLETARRANLSKLRKKRHFVLENTKNGGFFCFYIFWQFFCELSILHITKYHLGFQIQS